MRMEDCGKRGKTGELSYGRQKMLEEEERKIAFYVNCATSLNTNREDKLLNSALCGTNFLELTVMRKNDKEKGMLQNVAGS
jgi:hypothetical protein